MLFLMIIFLAPIGGPAHALLSSVFFGGKVVFKIPCTCVEEAAADGGFSSLLYVGPPRGGSFMLTPQSKQYQYSSANTGNWVLGLAGDFDTCSIQVYTYCVTVGGGPVIKKIGTSR